MSESFLIRGAALPTGERADVLLQGGRIAEVGSVADVAGATLHAQARMVSSAARPSQTMPIAAL